ncbi:MAG: ATP-binding cassette domain-containing protein, partial [Acidimicrobiales bacterium]|nr:ATP-binding cassette domain-containing protein [Acidimicrobiales bacterium]
SVFGVPSSRYHEVANRVGAIVENPKMFPNFSGRKNLSLLAGLNGIPSNEIDRVLSIVGLADRAKDTFSSYSLGMKQRLAIAAALLKNPDLLILDEPGNGLDPAGIAEMRVLIRGIADEGKAVLVSSHQLAEIEMVCDDVTIISRGKLIETGTLDHIRSFAGGDNVVVSIPDREAALSVLTAAGFTSHRRPTPNELVVDVLQERTAEVTKALADSGLYLTGLRSERPTLETAFLNLTGAPPPPTVGDARGGSTARPEAQPVSSESPAGIPPVPGGGA